MLSTLQHRGPDGEGVFISPDRKIALGHKRLSFIDLSDNGKQPFINSNNKIVLTFNGEIYNYLELKKSSQQLIVSIRKQIQKLF